MSSLLPAIEKARREFAQREAAERDIPEGTPADQGQEEGHDVNGDGKQEGGKKPMAVSQIQYSALRSMGGIRRNSILT